LKAVNQLLESKLCPFCNLPVHRVVDENALALVVRDAYPISAGHTLVLPKRHVGSFFDLGTDEREAMMRMLDAAKGRLDKELAPAAYNVGINDGPCAGQTVPHVHVHLIPRYPGDTRDPRGGVRWVLPEKADYWS
jgi:diadenosine tetraphosphate (Ap4A) HIT family hydrolase